MRFLGRHKETGTAGVEEKRVRVSPEAFAEWLQKKLGDYYLRFTLPRNGFQGVINVSNLAELDTLRDVLRRFGLEVLGEEEMGELWRPYIVAIRTRAIHSAVDGKRVGFEWLKDGYGTDIQIKSTIGSYYEFEESILDSRLHVGVFDGVVIGEKLELAVDNGWPAEVGAQLGWGDDIVYLVEGYKQVGKKNRR